MLEEAAGSLEQAKGNFREKVRGMVETFGRKVSQVTETFTTVAPFSAAGLTSAAAMRVLEEQRTLCVDVRTRAAELKAGMDIFNILQPPYKEVGEMERSLDMLTSIWGVVREWEGSYDTWKLGKFKDIQVSVRCQAALRLAAQSPQAHQQWCSFVTCVALAPRARGRGDSGREQELEEAATRIGKSVTKLGRDMKHLEVWQTLKETIDGFKKTMPLISDMRNPAMRPRHWSKLMDTIQTHFDPYADSFTLDSIVQLRLDQHAEFIAEMSLNATKELAIEQSIQAIAATWKDLSLDMVRAPHSSMARCCLRARARQLS